MSGKIVAGNWKMNTTKQEALDLVTQVIQLVEAERPKDVEMIIGVPFVHLQLVGDLIRGTDGLHLAAQNCSQHASGAYTGEVSAAMLASYQVTHVILGHSERRQNFEEKEDELRAKIAQVLAHGMKVIYCCGETLDQRNAGIQVRTVSAQLDKELFQLSAEEMAQIIIAYEPVWAIGTGVTATTDQAQEMHAEIRQMLVEKYGNSVADSTSILYGGSAKPSNAPELFACQDVDGGLIGGASLDARSFMDIALSYPR